MAALAIGARATAAPPGVCADLLDNGAANGVDGYSNATENVFSERRTMLDDFEVPDGATWTIDTLRHTHVWDTRKVPSGIGLEIAFRRDAAGRPGDIVAGPIASGSYSEVATGSTFFGRPEMATRATFEAIALDAGRYWLEATIVGPDDRCGPPGDERRAGARGHGRDRGRARRLVRR